jgi:hypothetical protein
VSLLSDSMFERIALRADPSAKVEIEEERLPKG